MSKYVSKYKGKNYRIIQEDEKKFSIQEKGWFLWSSLGNYEGSVECFNFVIKIYKSKEECLDKIKELCQMNYRKWWRKINFGKGKVVKELNCKELANG